jgi:hypothetical protein
MFFMKLSFPVKFVDIHPADNLALNILNMIVLYSYTFYKSIIFNTSKRIIFINKKFSMKGVMDSFY